MKYKIKYFIKKRENIKRENLICPSCEKVGPLEISDWEKGRDYFHPSEVGDYFDLSAYTQEKIFFEYTGPNLEKRYFICNNYNCHTILTLNPILDKIEYYKKIDIEFIKEFDFDLLPDNLYTNKNVFGIIHIFEKFVSNYISDLSREEAEYKDLIKLKSFYSAFFDGVDGTKKNIPRNLKGLYQNAVGKSIFNQIERWNYENRLMYCSICESNEHDDEDCDFAW